MLFFFIFIFFLIVIIDISCCIVSSRINDNISINDSELEDVYTKKISNI